MNKRVIPPQILAIVDGRESRVVAPVNVAIPSAIKSNTNIILPRVFMNNICCISSNYLFNVIIIPNCCFDDILFKCDY